MSCHHRHGPWCCDHEYVYPDYLPRAYPGYAYPPSPPPPDRRPRADDLEAHLAELEAELARVRQQLASPRRDEADS